jgi:radical SAM superfamily enzyme YgiQ (UPF0313 family)
MKVVLISSTLEWEKKVFQQTLPLGIAYLAAVLEKAAIDVEVIDFRFANCRPVDDCIPIDADVIGFSAFTFQFPFALDICKKLRAKGFKGKLVFGGPHASATPLDVITHEEIDAVFVGEAEESFPLYLDYLKGKVKKENLIRTYLSITNGIFHGKEHSWIKSLDSLPFPARHLFPISHIMEGEIRHVNVLTTRGCPYNCTFCQPLKKTLFGQKIRRRSVGNVIAELIHCKDKYDITNFGVVDDTFTFNIKYIIEFCNSLIDAGFNLDWACQTRSDIDISVLGLMRKSGCHAMWIGIESGSQIILDKMEKKTSVEENKKFIETCRSAGIATLVNMMVGYPGETEEDLKKSVEFIEETKPDQVIVSQVTPFPGSYIYESDDVIKQDYSQVARHIFGEKFKSMIPLQDKIVESASKMARVFESFSLGSGGDEDIDKWLPEIPSTCDQIFIFGTAVTGQKTAENLKQKNVKVAAFFDNYMRGHIDEIPIKKPFKPSGDYSIILASNTFREVMRKQLEDMGVPPARIFELLTAPDN